MTCRDFLEFISTYLDGELPAPELAEFERHLSICPACVRYLASYSTVVKATQAALADSPMSPQDAPTDLIEAILAAKRREN